MLVIAPALALICLWAWALAAAVPVDDAARRVTTRIIATRSPAYSPVGPRHLAIVMFSAPVDINVGEEFKVFATGCDDGAQISKLRIAIGTDSYVQFEPVVNPLNGGLAPCVTGFYDLTVFKRGLMKVYAQVQSINGTWGAPHTRTIIVHDQDNTTNAFFNTSDPAFINRLTNYRYPIEVGSLVNGGVLPFSSGPWWLSFYDSTSRVPFSTRNCHPAVQYPRIVKSRTRVFWPQYTTDAILACWLQSYPAVAASIVWEALDPTQGRLCGVPVECPVAIPVGVVTRLPYSSWTPAMKLRLNFEFYAAYRWLFYGTTEAFVGTAIPDVPQNQITLSDLEPAVTLLSQTDAWNLYVNNVAHSLAMEIGGFCKFSIVKYQELDLAVLFDAHTFFSTGFSRWTIPPAHTTSRAYTGYWISDGLVDAPAQVTHVMPAPAQTTFAFMLQHDIPRPAGKDVVAQLFTWGRNGTLAHTYDQFDSNNQIIFDDGMSAIGAQTFWQYRGAPNSALLMTGTTMAYPYNNPQAYIIDGLWSWTIGCPCTSFFLQSTLRAHNIPTQAVQADVGVTGHTVPIWFTLGYTMSHGDDLYDSDGWATPPAPSPHFLLSLTTFNNWFYGSQRIGDGLGNVGRQPDVEVALMDLTDKAVQAYCVDKAANAAPSDGLVYNSVFVATGSINGLPAGVSVPYYTVAQLQAQNLWTRLDAKAAGLGLC